MKVFDVELATAMTKLMAKENIDVEFKDCSTAHCEIVNRKIVFPTRFIGLDRDVMSIFSAHEVSHALYTPTEMFMLMDVYGEALVAILEDARIENKIKKDYVGITPMFSRGYKRLNEEFDFFGLLKRRVDVNQLSFLDRINLKCKIGDSIDVDFSEKETKFLNKVRLLDSPEDVVVLCKEYVDKFSEETKKNKGNDSNQEESGQGDKKAETEFKPGSDRSKERSPDDSQDDQKPEQKAEKSGTDRGESESSGLNDESDKGETEEEEKNRQEAGKGPNGNESPKEGFTFESSEAWSKEYDPLKVNEDPGSYTQKYLSKSISKIFSFKEIEDRMIVSWNELSSARMKNNHSVLRFNEFVSSSTAKKKKRIIQSNACVMANEFEAKKAARSYSRSRVSKTGELDPNKLVHYRYSDDIFLSSVQLPNDKNHGMILIVDISGSMSKIMKSVQFQLLILVEYCRMINIPFEVYAFSDKNLGSWNEKFRVNWEGSEGVIGYSRYYLNWFSSRMSKREYDQAFNEILFMHECGGMNGFTDTYDCYCGTPLNEVRADSIALTDGFLRRTNVEKFSMIYLTDGEGHYVSVSNMVSWKNKIYYETERLGCEERLYRLYKKIYPNFNVINLFLVGNRVPYSAMEKMQKNGFYFVGRGEDDYFNTQFFDINYRIDTRVMRNMNQGSSVRNVYVNSIEDTEDALDTIQSSFVNLSQNKKKMNAISKSISSQLV